MTDRDHPDEPHADHPEYPAAHGAGFDDESIDDPELYAEPAGFDDEAIDYGAYAADAPAPVVFGGSEYDADGARQLRAESLRRVRGGSGGAMLVGMLVLFMLGAIPVLVVAVLVFSQKDDAQDPVQVVETKDGQTIVKVSGPPPSIDWSDVSQGGGQNLGGLAVKVTQVSVGKARARDANNRVVFTGNDYLRIGLEIESFRDGPVEYVSWYGREVEQFSGRDRVRLYDESGAELPPHVFAEVQDLEGHTPRATLGLRDEVRDVIYFDLPEDKDVRELGDLRLTIPLDNPRSDQKYGFLIANDLIAERGDSSTTIDPTAPLSAEDLEALTADEDMNEDESDDEEPAP